MSKRVSNPNTVGVNSGDRSVRTRTPSVRRCCACQCNATSPRTPVIKQVARKRPSSQPKPKKLGPDVLPSVSRARSSVQLRGDALKSKPRKTATVSTDVSETVSGDASATATAEKSASARLRVARLSRKKTGGVKEVSRVRRTSTVKDPTLHQKADPGTSKLKKPAVPEQDDTEMLTDIDGSLSDSDMYSDDEAHITWEGFDEPDYRLGRDCCLCEMDLAHMSSEYDNETEFSTLPVVAMLSCGHAFHLFCLDQAGLDDIPGDPPCLFCESMAY